MKKIILLLFLCPVFIINAYSQTSFDEKYVKETIDNTCRIITDFYVFPDVAKATTEHLQSQLKSGAFDTLSSKTEFAKMLTAETQFINKDKHMRVWLGPIQEPDRSSTESIVENQLAYRNQKRESVGGFSSVQRLAGNVGYLDYRGFQSFDASKEIIDSYMVLLETSDAIVIDLRKNGGGSPKTVQYLCSYFIDKVVHLNSLYYRDGDETIEYWTLDQVDGEKLPEVPLFIITSPRTFSGAEEFTYNMKTQKRATIVGETSGGGANPGNSFRINEDFIIFVPTGTAINPITKTNWEGTGIEPDVLTNAENAYDKAIELAQKAAIEYRDKMDNKAREMYNGLISALDNASLQSDVETSKSADNEISNYCKTCVNEGILGENEINMLGYDYMMKNQIKPALALFKANISLFPESPNTYDSYAEALASSGNLEESKTYYEKAIQKAEEINDPNIDLYKDNLKNLNNN